jgi:hypothetical protein
MPRPRQIPAATKLADLPLVPTKVHVPRPVEMRLEAMTADLMKRARDLGEVTRGEIVGALLLSHKADASLVDDLRSYRDATAGQAVPGRKRITMPVRRRGRPSRQRR